MVLVIIFKMSRDSIMFETMDAIKHSIALRILIS